MKLFDYLMMFKSDMDFDVPDNEIDWTITVCFSKENAEEVSDDFPYMDKFSTLLLKKVDVAYLLDDGTPVCKFSDIINNNIPKFKKFIKDYWSDSYQCILEQENIDDGEFQYQFIIEFDNVMGGRYGESMNKAYYELLEGCK